jgi:hypothetical protein
MAIRGLWLADTGQFECLGAALGLERGYVKTKGRRTVRRTLAAASLSLLVMVGAQERLAAKRREKRGGALGG